MSNRGNRFSFFKKLVFKFKNLSSKFDNLLLGSDFKSNNSNKNKDYSNLDYIIVPEHNELNDKSKSSNKDSNNEDNKFFDDLSKKSEKKTNNLLNEDMDSKYAKYIHESESDSSDERLYEEYLNELKKIDSKNSSDDKSLNGDFDSNSKFGDNNGFGDFESISSKSENNNNFNSKNLPNLGKNQFNHGLDSENNSNNPLNNFDYGFSDGRYNDEDCKDEKNDFKDSLKNFKKNLLNKDEKSKNRFGKIAFVLIFLVLASTMLYFFVYEPFQEQVNLEKNTKLNELNALYKGPLEVNAHADTLKNQIENENDLQKLKSIDVLRVATEDWQKYHNSKIISSKDDFGRVMLSYYEDDSKNIIMSVDDADDFVSDNDAKILSNIQFKKVDTVIVPISLSRLQATAGLISVGSIVDIYSLDDNSSYYGDNYDSSGDSNSQSSALDSSDSGGFENSSSDSLSSDEVTIEENSSSSHLSDDSNLNTEDASAIGSGNVGTALVNDSQVDTGSSPNVSGATVLAILRSKDSGVVDSSISRSSMLVKGNNTTPAENTKSFSADVEELLKASVFGSYSGNDALESYLNDYGVKLSDYERMSNLGDLDSEYVLLLEVPRSDVNFVINNMDNLILTIPTQYAPGWVVDELNQTYYEEITTNDDFSFI